MRFSVIIPTYNCESTILRVLASVEQQDFPRKEFEIICVDDKSSDNTLQLLENVPHVKVMTLPRNHGNGTAKNVAAHEAHGEILFFVDDHMYLAPNVLKLLNALFRKHAHISGVCGSYRSYQKTDMNIIRDIRRRAVYNKNLVGREITIRHFCPFSITIGALKKSLFYKNAFPEYFGKNGAEDVLLQLLHLHDGQTFYFAPEVKGWHDHNLNYWHMLCKLFIEIHGTEELIYDLSQKNLKIPYQYGFLSFPLTFMVAFVLIFASTIFIPIAIFLLLIEIFLACRCLSDKQSTLSFRIHAVLYVLAGELLKGFYILFYIIHKRHLKLRLIPRCMSELVRWECEKYAKLLHLRIPMFAA